MVSLPYFSVFDNDSRRWCLGIVHESGQNMMNDLSQEYVELKFPEGTMHKQNWNEINRVHNETLSEDSKNVAVVVWKFIKYSARALYDTWR